jgi:hypothetical protein
MVFKSMNYDFVEATPSTVAPLNLDKFLYKKL